MGDQPLVMSEGKGKKKGAAGKAALMRLLRSDSRDRPTPASHSEQTDELVESWSPWGGGLCTRQGGACASAGTQEPCAVVLGRGLSCRVPDLAPLPEEAVRLLRAVCSPGWLWRGRSTCVLCRVVTLAWSSLRIAVFSVTVLHDDRIVLVAEQRPDASEEDSFQWMSRVLQVGPWVRTCHGGHGHAAVSSPTWTSWWWSMPHVAGTDTRGSPQSLTQPPGWVFLFP